MGVMIQPIPDSARVKVSGDIETVLSVPFNDDDRFMVGLSDGTLLIGYYDANLRCRFDVAREGAGIVRFMDEGANVDFNINWATVSAYDPAVAEPSDPEELPLFPLRQGDDDLDDSIPW